jgi:DNA-3-methyladenine glycosylase II
MIANTTPADAGPAAVEFDIAPVGPFSLREAAEFGFGQRPAEPFDGVMRLAFCLDRSWEPVGVEVRQDHRGVHGRVWGSTDVAAVRGQVARVLSLDVDGDLFTAIGRADPVIGRLQELAPGLRPPLFYSPYEAAVWAVMSARRPARQVIEVRRRISTAHGRTFELGGRATAALPGPAELLALGPVKGLSAEKVARLQGVAAAALDGLLDVDRLRRLGPDAALIDLQRLKGIGGFYASLVVIRACGFADVLPTEERHLLGLVAELYGLAGPPSPRQLSARAEPWRPLRTWAAVTIRAVGPRLLGRAAPIG